MLSVGKHINKSLSALKKPVFLGKIRIIQMSKDVNMKKKMFNFVSNQM